MPPDGSTAKSDDVLPRPGSAEYNFIMADDETTRRSLKKWKKANRYFMVPLYRVYLLPLFGIGRIFLLLYTKGSKTGRKRISPLEYHRIDGVIHIFSGRGDKAHWLGNLKANPDDVKIKVGFRKYDVHPEIIKSRAKRDEIFMWYVKEHPRAAKMLIGWKPGKDDPETADFSLMTKFIPVIKLHRQLR